MVIRPLLGFALLLAASGCVPTSTKPPMSPDGMTCGQRLVGGMWKFSGFQADRPLEPQAARALEQLHGTLRLGFDGQQALTTGPGLYHLGPYQIADDDGVSCRLIAPDDARIVTETRIRFLDANHLEVLDQRSAVPGRASMERVPVGR